MQRFTSTHTKQNHRKRTISIFGSNQSRLVRSVNISVWICVMMSKQTCRTSLGGGGVQHEPVAPLAVLRTYIHTYHVKNLPNYMLDSNNSPLHVTTLALVFRTDRIRSHGTISTYQPKTPDPINTFLFNTFHIPCHNQMRNIHLKSNKCILILWM